jgi:hypothetical protein
MALAFLTAPLALAEPLARAAAVGALSTVVAAVVWMNLGPADGAR